MCRPNGLLFQQKSLDMGPIWSRKSLEEGPISQKSQKNCKISPFWGRKTLRNGSRFAKISKKLLNQPFFEEEKSLDMGRGFRPRATHPVKNNLSTPPPDPLLICNIYSWWLLQDPLICSVCLHLYRPIMLTNYKSRKFTFHIFLSWKNLTHHTFSL